MELISLLLSNFGRLNAEWVSDSAREFESEAWQLCHVFLGYTFGVKLGSYVLFLGYTLIVAFLLSMDCWDFLVLLMHVCFLIMHRNRRAGLVVCCHSVQL